MLYKFDELSNLVKDCGWMPGPAGDWHVGYVDIMTEGLPSQSQFIRLFYPTKQNAKNFSERCHVWSLPTTKHGFINFIKAQIHHWPSWANKSEFKLYDFSKVLEKFGSLSFQSVFSVLWQFMCKNLKIPTLHQAQPASPPSGKWPVVIFSHGLGCNRYAYSKICYDLCSEGYVVASVEHRDGSACHSTYFSDQRMHQIVHMQVEKEMNEYTERNNQANHRREEVNRTLHMILRLNEGIKLDNVLENEQGYDLSDFTGKLDTEEIYLMGHSFGGCTALFTASQHKLFKGIICMDPWMFPVSKEKFSVNTPVLLISTESFARKENIQKVQEVCADLNSKLLRGAVHLVHTDAPLLMVNDYFASGLGMLCTRKTEEVLQENHLHISSWISSISKGEDIEKTSDWGVTL